MQQPLVSITMSTYNVEEYIKESLNCLVNQTLHEIEVICIDDGSTDETLQILNYYATTDKRIQVVSKSKNEGLAIARNEALKLAKGKYITFLDGDDLYDLEMIQKAYELAEKDNSDLVIWDYVTFWDAYNIEKLKQRTSALASISGSNKVALLQRPAFTWVKLLKTEKVKELGIYFPVGLTRQDIPVHWHLITQLDKISILPERLSYYRQQPEATTAKKDKKLFHLAYVMDIVKQYLSENKIYDKYKNEFLRQQLNLLFGMYDSVKEEYKKEALSIIKERLTDDHYSFIKQNNAIRKQAKYFYLSLRGNPLFKIKYQVWLTLRAIYRKIKS
ncbi:MAG: glycosyltransferase family 2 protein [Flavobacterium sp.]|nr:glycosyltransferase family 2 protein [Flavobacterium sp.]